MSWWDYGYQIAGMANRTTLVDNNTWNNSHIALVRAAVTLLTSFNDNSSLWWKGQSTDFTRGEQFSSLRSATQLCHNVFWLKTQTTAKIHLFSTCNNKAEASSAHNMDILLTFKWIWWPCWQSVVYFYTQQLLVNPTTAFIWSRVSVQQMNICSF